MKRMTIDASREVRLWIGQVIIPAMIFVAAVPEARQFVRNTARECKSKVKEKLDDR